MRSLRFRVALAGSVLLVISMLLLGFVLTFGESSYVTAPWRIGLAFLVAAGGVLAAIGLTGRVMNSIAGELARMRRAVEASAGRNAAQRAEGGNALERARFAPLGETAGPLGEREAVLIPERSRLEELLAASADALIVVDRDGRTQYLNLAAKALFGEAIGRPLVEMARNHDLNSLIRKALPSRHTPERAATGQRFAASIHLDSPDIWVQASTSPIGGDTSWAMLVVLHDITEVRRAETARRDFVASISHELRTPLAGIKAVVETLRDGALHDPDAADEFLERVDTEVDRLVQLVEELLQLARIESGAALNRTAVEPNALLEACVERFRYQAQRAGLTLTLDAPAELPDIHADPARLDQAVGNLIHNALKFTPTGGTVSVSASAESRHLTITVTDTGIGLDPADLQRVFERFYIVDRARSGHQGTGLGLAIVKHVALAHGGAVEAKSTPGHGSSFSIILPLPSTSG